MCSNLVCILAIFVLLVNNCKGQAAASLQNESIHFSLGKVADFYFLILIFLFLMMKNTFFYSRLMPIKSLFFFEHPGHLDAVTLAQPMVFV